MLSRCLFRGTRSNAIPSRFYRTKGAKGKPKTADGQTISLKSLGKGLNITHGSDQHHDLPTFLTYASQLNLSPTSPVYVGTHYEYTAASSLRALGFSLTRTGRASDYGIDLLGHWSVPSVPTSLRVLLQCKAHNKALTPANVRELEGAFVGAPAGWKGEGVLGFLVATMQATKGMRDALIRSHVPMGFLQVTADGKVLQFIWNHEASQRGLEGMGVTSRFNTNGINGVEQEIALTWNGWTLSREQQEVTAVRAGPKKTSRGKDVQAKSSTVDLLKKKKTTRSKAAEAVGPMVTLGRKRST